MTGNRCYNPLYGLLAAWHRIYEPSLSRQILPRRYQSVQGRGLYKGCCADLASRQICMDNVLCQEASKPHMYVPPLHALSKCGGTPHAHAHMHIFPSGIPSVVKNREDDVCRKFMTQQQAQMRAVNERQRELTSGDIGLLTGPHQTSLSEFSSRTMRLSDGDRPVFAPEYADSAPVDVMAEPVS